MAGSRIACTNAVEHHTASLAAHMLLGMTPPTSEHGTSLLAPHRLQGLKLRNMGLIYNASPTALMTQT